MSISLSLLLKLWCSKSHDPSTGGPGFGSVAVERQPFLSGSEDPFAELALGIMETTIVGYIEYIKQNGLRDCWIVGFEKLRLVWVQCVGTLSFRV